VKEPNWPPPEWGTPELGWDIPANVGRVDSENDVHPVSTESEPPAPRRRPQRWCLTHRTGYRPPSYHERCSVEYEDTPGVPLPPHSTDCWSCRMNYDTHYHEAPIGVVEHQRYVHEIEELQNRIHRLERRVDQMEGRVSVDDISDGPWSMDPEQWPVDAPPAYYHRGHH
jgi:hypothetical protein